MSFRDWPMERKFLFGTLTITLTAIAVISTVLILSEQRAVRQDRLDNSRALLGMIANNAAAALVYDDQNVGKQILAGASAEPSTRAAALYDASGELFAWFPAEAPVATLPSRPMVSHPQFTGKYLDLFAPVEMAGKPVGTAFLRLDLTAMRDRFRWYFITVLGAAAVAVLLAILLSRAVHRWISEPLVSLSRTAKTIAASGTYSIRAQKNSTDEVGELVDAFNRMVQEVESSQRQIQDHAANLEQEVAQRTAALRETVHELEAFSYSISHDLRAPLRAMEGYAAILLEDSAGLDSDSREYLQRISRASKRMDQLLRDILSYSRVTKADMKLEDVDLDRVVNDVLTEYPQFSAPHITIDIRRPLGRVRGHNASLGQVFSNLIGNAIKFIPADGAARVEIWSQRTATTCTVYVRDHGIGIPAQALPRLFRIFERAHDPRKFEGTGIGLSIVKKAVDKMNGRVGVTSQEGEGSTFWFELPVAEKIPVAAPPPAHELR